MTTRLLTLCMCLLSIASSAVAHAQSWIDISDVVYLKAHIFESGPPPQCTCSDYQ